MCRTASQLALALQCIPVNAVWDKSVKGTCFDQRKFFVGQGIPHILTDFAILVSPIYPVWQLNMKRYQKVAMTAVFGMGGW